MTQPQRNLAVVVILSAIFISSHTQAESPVEQSSVPDFAVDSGDFSPFREGTFSSFVDGVFEMNLSLQEVRNIDLLWNGENVKTNRTGIYKEGILGEYVWSARAIDGSIYTLQREAFDEEFAPFEGLAIYNPPLLWYPASPFLGQNWTNTENGNVHQMEVINLNGTSPGGIEGCVVIRETKSGDWQEDQFFKDGRFVGNIWTDLTGSTPDESVHWSIEILLDDTTLGNSVMTGDSVTQDGVTMQVISVLATDGGASAAVEDWGILFGTDSTADDVESISISFNVDVRVIAYEIGSREDVPSGMYLTISGAEGTSGQNPIPPFAGFTLEEITLPYVPGGLSVLKAGHTYTITHNLLDATTHDPLFNLEALYVVPVESGGGGDTFATWPLLASLPPDRREPEDRNGPLNLPNLLAFAMGIDPLSATPADLPQVGSVDQEGGTVTFQYHRATGVDGITLIPMVSENLAGWQPADTSALAILETGEGWQRVEISLPVPSSGKLFMRLEAQMTP